MRARAPEGFAIKRHRRFRRMWSAGSRWHACHNTFGPRSQLRLEPRAVQTPENQVECRRTGWDMPKAERPGDMGAIMAAPFSDGARATSPPEHGATGQRQHGREGMPKTTSAANVWNASKHFK
jgi:hypothetical protein